MNGNASVLPWVQMARKVLDEMRPPTQQEKEALLEALHNWRSSLNPEAGRVDAALALKPVRESLPVESRLALGLVLHEWDEVVQLLEESPEVRAYLFHALCTETPSIRKWLVRKIDRSFCHTPAEELMLDFARADFVALRGWAADEDLRGLLLTLLRDMLTSPNWGLFHKDQASRLLRLLGEKSEPVRRPARRLDSGKGEVLSATGLTNTDASEELHGLLQHLRTRGLVVDGKKLFPEIHVGTVTGRITYREPPVQTWPAQERRRRIQPCPGSLFVALDYGQIEPLVLLNVLVQRLWLALTDMPRGDVYTWFCPEDRSLGKQIVNKIINGGTPALVDPAPATLRFVRAIEMFRQEWTAECHDRGAVVSLWGRSMPLPDPPNVPGKLVNRLVQGTAADIFNHAVAEIHRLQMTGDLAGEVALVIHDEVWIEVSAEEGPEVARMCAEVMRKSAARVCLFRTPEVKIEMFGGGT